MARSSPQPGDNSSSLDSNPQGQPLSQATARAAVEETTAASASGAVSEGRERVTVTGHRGSGGLVTGKAVFCLPPNVEWFQGHFAYAARGGCTASLGVLGTELPVDPVSENRTWDSRWIQKHNNLSKPTHVYTADARCFCCFFANLLKPLAVVPSLKCNQSKLSYYCISGNTVRNYKYCSVSATTNLVLLGVEVFHCSVSNLQTVLHCINFVTTRLRGNGYSFSALYPNISIEDESQRTSIPDIFRRFVACDDSLSID